MKLGNILSKENLTAVGAGVAGAAVSVPAKKYLFAKIPGLSDNENLQNGAVLLTGIAIAAFSKGRVGKTFGLGMSIVGGYNLVTPLLTTAGLAGDVMMGAVPAETSAPMMGAVDVDFPTGGEGEMEY
jgi:hypothetical protein